jgi:hypothetical protein
MHTTILREDTAEESAFRWLRALGRSQDFHRTADADGFVFYFARQRMDSGDDTAAGRRFELRAQRV